jgi:hypothetical protein
MRKIAAIAILGLLVTPAVYAQGHDLSMLTVSRIRRVTKSKRYPNKPAIEVTLSNLRGFYVGGLYWCLRIGRLPGVPEGGGSDEGARGNTRAFVLTMQEWKKLRDGDPLWLSWGCRQASAYEGMPPFANLNKKMLRKK